VLNLEKKELMLEKMTFNQRVSEIQEKYEKTQELLDSKNQKYKDMKSCLKRIQEDGLDKD
jgi:uncharacterized membrane-anchored protein YhcB (DUF1043 family)